MSSIQGVWTPEEDRWLRSGEWSRAEIAQRTGRSISAVNQHARRLGLAQPKPQQRWSSTEIDFLRAHRESLTAAQIGDRLGRPENAVQHAAKKHGLALAAGKGGFAAQPLWLRGQIMIGSRTLIAKTCTQCGRLLAARRFSRRTDTSRRGHWEQPCRGCKIAMAPAQPKAKKLAASAKHRTAVETYTRSLAMRSGEPYSGEDDSHVRDVSKSLIQVAVEIGRTYSSVATRAQQLGINRRPNPDQHKHWVVLIHRSSVEAALEMERQGLIDSRGVPTEDQWDWNDEQVSA